MRLTGTAAVGVQWPHWRLATTGAVLTLVTAVGPTLYRTYGGWALMIAFVVGGAGALLASRMRENTDARGALIVILGAAVLMRLAMLFVEPYLSTDIYRYVWDGRVQAAGINPYRFVPSAAEVAHLRDDAIFPNINRAEYAVTIYPPAAQAIFLAVTRFGESVVAMKLGLLTFEAAIIAALLALLRGQGSPTTRVAAYAWHPLPILEIAGNGHVDVAMCGLLMAGLLLFLHGRTLLAGVLVTMGALVKPTALLALPVFWRPWNWRLPLVVLSTAVLAYLPYLSVGRGVFGYLGGYVEEEGFSSGRGINLLWLMETVAGPMPQALRIYIAVAALTLIGIAVAVAIRKDRSQQTTTACLCWLLVIFMVLISPHYPWYFVVLVPFLAIHPLATAWTLTLACPLLYAGAEGDGWPNYDVRIAVFMLATAAALTYDAWSSRRKHDKLTVGATL